MAAPLIAKIEAFLLGCALALGGCASEEPFATANAGDDDAVTGSAPDVEKGDGDQPAPSGGKPPSRAAQQPPADSDAPGGGPPAAGQAFGDWTYYTVEGAICRDGSPAGYYIRKGTSSNLLIFLNGGGICYDDFFCGINPANVDSSLPGEDLLGASLDIAGSSVAPVRQTPPDAGIFARDPRNPMGDWSMVYVPYCTGDLHAGTKRDSEVFTAALQGKQQFVGYTNLGLFYDHFGADYRGKSDKVVLSGSSAGGFGTLLNFDRTQEFFGDDTRVYAVTDSGVPFRDMYLEPCLQKNVRELYGLSLPKDCKGCFDASGGGLATGLGDYIFREKYAGRFLGGGISTKQDEIIKLFFSLGLDNCSREGSSEAVGAFLGASSYPEDRYPTGLADFIDNVGSREQMGSYIMEGTLHQHLFRSRFYDLNGLGTSMADWLSRILDDEPVHLGTL